MTSLVHKLGLSKSLAFYDVFSISDPDLLAFVPRPTLALLLVFPVSTSYQQHRIAEDAGKEEYSKQGDGEDPVWFKQTIKNACGMIGVLHAVCNGAARDMIGTYLWYTAISSPLDTKKKRRKRKHRNKSSEKRAGEKVGQKMRKRYRVLEMSIRF